MKKSIIIFLFGWFTMIQSIPSEELKLGNDFPIISIEDQFQNKVTIDLNTKMIFFSATKEAAEIIHSFLINKEDDFLNKYNIINISDIHKMPSLIYKFVAAPKMKGYKYKIGLIQDDKTGKIFPSTNGKITILKLEKGKIISIEFASNKDEIIRLIGNID